MTRFEKEYFRPFPFSDKEVGRVKVRSVAGHHVQVLTKMSNLLNNPDILTIGNAMRMKRNLELYSGGEFISKKETGDYIHFTKQVIDQVGKVIKAQGRE